MNTITIALSGIAIGSMAVSIVAARRDRQWVAIGAAANTAVALSGIGFTTGVFG